MLYSIVKGFFAFFVLAILIIACGTSDEKANLPKSAGPPGYIYLFMDSTQWKGPLGHTLDSALNQTMDGLPRDEGIFQMTWVEPRKLNMLLKQRRNMIFVMTLDKDTEGARVIRSLFSEGLLQQIATDTSTFVQTHKNVFARDQQIMFLFAKDEQLLLKKIQKNSQRIIDFFNKVEADRLKETLLSKGIATGMSKWLLENYHADLKIPYGYKMVDNKPEFFWARQINPQDDRDIWIARTDYVSEDQFKPENLIKLRNEMCKKYLYEDPEKIDSYLITETNVPYKPVVTKAVTLNGQYAVEMRGLWVTNTHTMGGPFIGYAIADNVTGKFFYIEGFTYAPSQEQRELSRQMEVILKTFELESAAKPESK